MIEKHAAEALDGGADRLTVHDPGVDRAADVFDRQIVDTSTWPVRVDRDVRRVGAVAVGALRVGERAVDHDRSGTMREFGKRQCTPVEGARTRPSPKTIVVRTARAILRRGCANGVEEVLRAVEHRRAAHHQRARVIGAEALVHEGRRAMPHAECVDRQRRARRAAICANTVSSPCPNADEPT